MTLYEFALLMLVTGGLVLAVAWLDDWKRSREGEKHDCNGKRPKADPGYR